ncbi:PST family polysaccharide transporter [Myroides gitamensis]|uniref:O-antigen transporter n=1 Tax=Myroides odoratus TaxID=256 RepID=A0A378RJ45_MYROD|nr:oligosaccharide flippase family protein [Myroides odoratus]MCS4238343.1 PST family polysaccharide transporter [Myroides odoratus]MDH6600850.1 PST family polysaccharide transporter [Myroides gitamensis]STZ27032.1 Putative O-antigen transporter [Myroides odoratus]
MELIKKIKEKLRNKDAKTLIENFISLSALQLVGMVLPLITLPYVLRVLGFEKYGVIVFSASLIAYFQSLTDFSFRITAVRDVAIFRNSPSKLNLIYSKVIWIKGIFLLISLLVITGIVLCVPSFYEYKEIYALSSLMLIGYALFPEWFFQGIEKMRYITYLNLGIKAFFTICIFVFIQSEEDYWIYPLLQGAGFIGAGIIGQYLLMRKYKLKLIWLPKKIIIDTIKNNFPLFINQFVPTLYNNTSTFLLGVLGTKSLVGMYQAILTIVNLAVTIIDVFSRVFFPFLNRKKDAFPKYRKILLAVTTVLSIGILASSKLIFWYLNIKYEHAFWVLLILVIGLIGYAFSNIFGLNYFLIKRMDKLVMKNTIRASLLGFVLAFPLITYFGIIGAAINLSFSRWMMGGGLYVKYLKNKK